MKLCSVIFPSRSRAVRCLKSIQSLLASEPELNDEIDIWIRLDSNDPQLPIYHEHFDGLEGINLVVGERGRGYGQLWMYYTELAKLTDAKWLMQWNDDTVMEGPWITGIKTAPEGRHWLQCEVHRLGGSTYPRDDGAPFVVLPNRFWEVIGLERIPEYTDTGSINALRKLGWTCHFLPDTSFHHERGNDSELQQHRRL